MLGLELTEADALLETRGLVDTLARGLKLGMGLVLLLGLRCGERLREGEMLRDGLREGLGLGRGLQAFVLHVWVCVNSGQVDAQGVVVCLIRVWVPPPQGALQDDHEFHSKTVQLPDPLTLQNRPS